MPHDVNKYLEDIRLCIVKIDEFLLKTPDFDTYSEQVITKLAIERLLAIIGEATSKLLKIWKDIPISNKEKIVAMRNIIVHTYDEVDDVIVWNALLNYLPTLKTEVLALLNDND